MTAIATTRRPPDHFEPEADIDPAEQRKMRGQLERIDYTAYAANREIISRTLAQTDLESFKRLALAAAQARARWVGIAVMLAETTPSPSPTQIEQLGVARRAFEELSEAYEGMRRMVERGYLPMRAGRS